MVNIYMFLNLIKLGFRIKQSQLNRIDTCKDESKLRHDRIMSKFFPLN